jgi:predicted nuclease of predicted toxin-antitoxin system
MRFLADMGVGLRVVQHLRAAGHDALHLAEQRLQRLPDRNIFAKARLEERIVLTFDLDFADIAAAAGTALPSVVLFRLSNTRTDSVIERLTIALNSAGPMLLSGAIVAVEDRRIRIRSLPIVRE